MSYYFLGFFRPSHPIPLNDEKTLLTLLTSNRLALYGGGSSRLTRFHSDSIPSLLFLFFSLCLSQTISFRSVVGTLCDGLAETSNSLGTAFLEGSQ